MKQFFFTLMLFTSFSLLGCVIESQDEALAADSTPNDELNSNSQDSIDSNQYEDIDSTQYEDIDSTQYEDTDSTQYEDTDSTQYEDTDSTQYEDTDFMKDIDSTQYEDTDSTQYEFPDFMICTADYTPVCGDDGKTYSNDCSAESAGIKNYTAGECQGIVDSLIRHDSLDITEPQMCNKIYAPVCGDDGQTYSNDCLAENAGIKFYIAGECQVIDSLVSPQCPVFIRSPLDIECSQGQIAEAVYDQSGCLIDAKCLFTVETVCDKVGPYLPSLDCSDEYDANGCYEASVCY